jgi:hypothetical protein
MASGVTRGAVFLRIPIAAVDMLLISVAVRAPWLTKVIFFFEYGIVPRASSSRPLFPHSVHQRTPRSYAAEIPHSCLSKDRQATFLADCIGARRGVIFDRNPGGAS